MISPFRVTETASAGSMGSSKAQQAHQVPEAARTAVCWVPSRRVTTGANCAPVFCGLPKDFT